MILGIPRPVAITIAPVGMGQLQQDHPALPFSLATLQQIAKECQTAGASMLCLPLLNEQGRYYVDPLAKGEVLEGLRALLEGTMLLQLDLSAPEGVGLADRLAMLDRIAPDSCQITLSHLLPRNGDDAQEDLAKDFLTRCAERNIGVQLEMCQPSDLDWFYAFRQYGVIPQDCRSLVFRLGNGVEGTVGEAHDLRAYLAMLDKLNLLDQVSWSVACHGPAEPMALAAAIALGGHIQTGFAMNRYTSEGEEAPSNSHQVATMAGIASQLARPAASALEARTLLF